MLERDNSLEIIKWDGSMWPLEESIITDIPDELKPQHEVLQSLRYPWELLKALQEKLQSVITEPRIHETVVIPDFVDIRGPVWIEEAVKIFPHTEIVGPVYIGKGTIVGNFVQLRDSYIGPNTLVGERTSIVRSVVGSRCSFHENYIGDSILMEEVDMGGGVKTANLRLDRGNIKSAVDGVKIDTGLHKLGVVIGKNVKFGADCRTMPGVKIGSNSIIGVAVTILQDLPDHVRCMVKQDLDITNIV